MENEISRSCAVWCEPITDKKADCAATCHVHLNYWRIKESKKREGGYFRKIKSDALDIGVRLGTPQDVESIHLFLPFEFERSQIVDLFEKVKNEKIARGIFNEKITKISESGELNRRFRLLSNNTNFLQVYNLNDQSKISSSDVDVIKVHGGTKLTIKREAIDLARKNLHDKEEIYFRFRVPATNHTGKSVFFREITPADYWLQSGYQSIQYLDFRLNEARNLPERIDEEIVQARNNSLGFIVRVDFFLVLKVEENIITSHNNWNKLRLLESEIWEDYLDGEYAAEFGNGMVIYHWKSSVKKEERVADFLAFLKIQVRLSTWKTLLRYIPAAVLIGVVSSVTAAITIKFLS